MTPAQKKLLRDAFYDVSGDNGLKVVHGVGQKLANGEEVTERVEFVEAWKFAPLVARRCAIGMARGEFAKLFSGITADTPAESFTREQREIINDLWDVLGNQIDSVRGARAAISDLVDGYNNSQAVA